MQQVFDVIRQYHMIDAGMRVIAGVSGGADSVYLLQVLAAFRQEVPFTLGVVHVEHGLRGEESREDAAFVRDLCDRMGIPCQVVSADVRKKAEQEGLSLEEAARKERYRIFEEVRQEQGAQRIAVAHNQNDQAETVLWNLARGSGLRGLGGIRPVQGAIIRPLLFTPRREIEEALVSEGIGWRTDSTNQESAFTRNRIRHDLLPLMERELNEKSTEHIAQAAGRLQEVQAYLDQQVQEALGRCRKDDTLLLEPFEKEEPLIQQEILRSMLDDAGGLKDVGAKHIGLLLQLAKMDCGRSLDLPGSVRAVREDGLLRFEKTDREKEAPDAAKQKAVSLPVPGSVRIASYLVTAEETAPDEVPGKQILQEKKYTKWISYDTIKHGLQLRTRQTGDYLIVNEAGGRCSLKDYLIDEKVPRGRRDEILLLADGSHILWVVGYRISEAAKVTPRTKRAVKIQILEDSDT